MELRFLFRAWRLQSGARCEAGGLQLLLREAGLLLCRLACGVINSLPRFSESVTAAEVKRWGRSDDGQRKPLCRGGIRGCSLRTRGWEREVEGIRDGPQAARWEGTAALCSSLVPNFLECASFGCSHIWVCGCDELCRVCVAAAEQLAAAPPRYGRVQGSARPKCVERPPGICSFKELLIGIVKGIGLASSSRFYLKRRTTAKMSLVAEPTELLVYRESCVAKCLCVFLNCCIFYS